MKNKLRYMFLSAISASLLVTGCGTGQQTAGNANDQSNAQSNAKPNDKPGDNSNAKAGNGQVVIGVAGVTLKEPYYVIMKQGADDKAKELGAKVNWQGADYNPTTQYNQVQDFVTQGVNVMVIHPVRSDASKQLVTLAKDAKIPVINLEAQIKDAKTDLRIVADSTKVGEMQVQDFVKEWGDKPANVVVLSGTNGSEVAAQITNGNMNILKQHPNLKVVGQQWHQAYDRTLAMNTMENMLTKYNNDIQVVFANNDSLILGAMKAAENAGVKDKIKFYGGNDDKETVQYIMDSAPVKTIDKGAYIEGQRIVEAAVKMAKGEQPPRDTVIDDTPVWYTPIEIVTKDHLDSAKRNYPELFKK